MRALRLLTLGGLLLLLALMALVQGSEAAELGWTKNMGMRCENDGSNCMALSEDGAYIVSADAASDQLILLDRNGTELWNYTTTTGDVTALDITADGKHIVAGTEWGRIILFNASSPLPVWSRDVPGATTKSVDITPDGRYILTYNFDDFNVDRYIKLISRNNTLVWEHEPTFHLMGLTISDDGQYVVLSGENAELYHNGSLLWGYTSYDQFTIPHMTPDGSRVVIGHENGTVSLFNRTGRLWVEHARQRVYHAAISADGKTIAVEDDSTYLTVFDEAGTHLWSSERLTRMTGIKITDNGSHIVVSHFDKLVMFQRSSTTPIWEFPFGGHDNAYFRITPDWSYLLVATQSPDSLKLVWNGDLQVFVDSITPGTTSMGIPVDLAGHGEHALPLRGYRWSSDLDGVLSTSATEPSLTVSNLSEGLHNISFQVRDWPGAWRDPEVIQLRIYARPIAINVSTPSNRTNEGQAARFYGNGSDDNGVAGYEWTSDRDGKLSNLSAFSIDSLSAGFHIIGFRVQDIHGSWSLPIYLNHMVNTRPVAYILDFAPAIPLVGEEVYFTGAGTDHNGLVARFEWDMLGDGSALFKDQNVTASFKYPAPGNYTVKLRVQDAEGAWSLPADLTVYINARPTVEPPTFKPVDPRVGDPVTLSVAASDADGEITAYRWDLLGDGSVIFTDEAPTALFAYARPGTYTVNLTVQDDLGAWSESVEFQVTVQPRAQGDGDDDDSPAPGLLLSVAALALAMTLTMMTGRRER